MKYLKFTFILVLLAALTAGCTSLSPYTYAGAGVGGALGAGTGALIDSHNRWRGAMIGTLIGGTLGGTTTELGRRAAAEDASQKRSYSPPAAAAQYNEGEVYQ
jgi:uncharacterized membrane protein YoaK (UPF0700 family)